VSDTAQYARNENILFGRSGSETFMMSVESGLYYALNETATRVWQILEQPRTRDEIVSALAVEYSVEATRCREEIGPFLAELVTRDILRTS
jgi:hypothetical protein